MSAWERFCPIEIPADAERITLAHGEGGKVSRRFLAEHVLPRLGNATLKQLGDAAALNVDTRRLAFTTDSFVVSPLFFPGGDIGSLAVFGTVNDLAVAGARPLWLSLAMILEEGLPVAILDRVLDSIAASAERANVSVVAGDTKVVPRGAADALYLNTAGIGELLEPVPVGPAALEPGDCLIVTGPIGRHGIAVLSSRENLGFEPAPASDCAPLFAAAESLRTAGVAVKAMRDATRGGVAAVLHEWAEQCRLTLVIDESRVPLTGDVRGACELLGLDPLQVACEGTMLIAVERSAESVALDALRGVPVSCGASTIGEVRPRTPAPVLVKRGIGRERPLDEPSGAPFPRIC